MKLGKLRIPRPRKGGLRPRGGRIGMGGGAGGLLAPNSPSSIHPQIAASAAAVSPRFAGFGRIPRIHGPVAGRHVAAAGLLLLRARRARASRQGERVHNRPDEGPGARRRPVGRGPQVDHALRLAEGKSPGGARIRGRAGVFRQAVEPQPPDSISRSAGATDARNIVAGTPARRTWGPTRRRARTGWLHRNPWRATGSTSHPDGWLWYSAEPVYSGDEPICREVVVDLRSDDGRWTWRCACRTRRRKSISTIRAGTRTCALE